jgi:signal transduction histidine kinase
MAQRAVRRQAQDKGDSVRRMYAHQDSGYATPYPTDRHTVSFWIQDTGVGFNPKDRELIFKRFGRANKNHRHSQGQGLGLSIVRAIAQAHRGKVEANGEIGKGATFTLILPLNKSRNQ